MSSDEASRYRAALERIAHAPGTLSAPDTQRWEAVMIARAALAGSTAPANPARSDDER